MREDKFVADQMLGKLARALRFLGYDTIYLNPAPDTTLVKIAKKEKRTLLTRDTLLLKRKEVSRGDIKAILLKSTSWEKQLKQVAACFKLNSQKFFLSSFCRECNNLLENVSKLKVKGKVPPYVYENQKEFSWCRGCGRYYWKGTHFQKLKERISALNLLV